MVYHVCKVTCAEAVVDVDDAHAAGAGIEHRKERRNAAEGRAVADTCRHGNNGAVGKPADYTCKRTFHACNGDNDACAHDFVNMRKEPVQPCNADIIKPKHTAAVKFRRQAIVERQRFAARQRDALEAQMEGGEA